MHPAPPPTTADLPIQEATLDRIRWFIPILHRLPRLHRHGLGATASSAARASLLSWNAHLAHGHTWLLRRRLFAPLPYAADLP